MGSLLRAPGEPRKTLPDAQFSTVLGTCTSCYRGVWLVDRIKDLGDAGFVGQCESCKRLNETEFRG